MKNVLFTLLIMTLWGAFQPPAQAQCNPDVEAPTPFCYTGLIFALNGAGDAVVFASDLNAGSSDNCTADSLLKFTFDSAGMITQETFTIEGIYTRRMYVHDEAGNVDYCETTIEIGCVNSIACNDRVVVDVPEGDSVAVHVDDVLEGGPYCVDHVFSFTDDPKDSIMWVYGDDFPLTSYEVTNLTTSITCWGSIANCHKTGPTAIVNSLIQLSLDASGKAIITPDIIDQGSNSPCSAVELFIRRMDHIGACGNPANEPRQEMLFCCRDIGDTVRVELIVRDDRGRENSAWTEVVVEDKLGFSGDCATVEGLVYKDGNDNCSPDSGEDSLQQVLVVVTDGANEYVTYTDENGAYLIFAPHGTYDVFAQSPGYYWNVCPTFKSITLDSANHSVVENFGLTESTDCPLMEVDLVLARLRRCFSNAGYINYYNTGTITAEDAYVELELDDDLSITEASVPYTNQGGGSYRFDIGDVPSFESGSISIKVYVDCDSTELGETKCVEAFIYPDTICGELLTWSGANVEVEAECIGDSVRFTLKNTGSGDMSSARDYHVIEDDVIMFMERFNLDQNRDMSFTLLADGATLRLYAEQEENHPFPFTQTVAVEGCDDGGEFSPEFFRMFPMGAQEPFKDIECMELIGSYDPNEKAASPEGYGVEHYLEPGNPITYTLYFQNTGTDTAFNVYIMDTISDHLDMATFQPGASSHPVDILFQEGRAIRFDFPNIMLPDSFVNEPASNGFVQFTITPKENLPLPTWITNRVGIFFDFNDPVVTNLVYHTIDTGFLEISTSVQWWAPDLAEIEVSPNPSTDWVTWKWSEDTPIDGRIQVLDLLGKTVVQREFNGTQIKMNLSGLHKGHYIFQIHRGDGLFATGKIILR